MYTKHKVFISYHHANDQRYKQKLVDMAAAYGLFIDRSVNTGAVSENLTPQRIREIIRDKYLRDSTVTIVLVGTETSKRKHVDWEIYSSMIDGKVNKKSGVLVITLPKITSPHSLVHAARGQEQGLLYLGVPGQPAPGRKWWKQAYPGMPDRIVDNLVKPEALVSVASWNLIDRTPELLRTLTEWAFRHRAKCKYDLGRPMRRRNS